MRSAGVDAVIAASPGLVAFLTGHVVPPQLAHPSRDGRLEKPTIAIVTTDDWGEATIGTRPEPTTGSAIPHESGGLQDDGSAFNAVLAAAVELGLTDATVAIESAFVPAAALLALRDGLPAMKARPLNDLLRSAKARKSAAELDGIAAALALCDAGQKAVRETVAPGVSELDLYSAAVTAMNQASDSQVLALGEIQVGHRGERMAGPPTAARLESGELAMCDLAPRHANGWWGDSCMTVACGAPEPETSIAWRRLRDGMEAAREVLRPGASAGSVHAAVIRHVPDLPGHAGHGIGRDHFEEPVLLPDNPEPLEEGSVIVVEPGIYGAGRGMRIEHAFRVSEDGGVPLSHFELEL